MSLPPAFIHLTTIPGSATVTSTVAPLNSVDLFLDFVCPFSKKLFLKFDKEVIPLLADKYPNKFRLIFRPVVQPWHAQASAATSEAFLAVNQVAPEQAWQFAKVLFEHQRDFFDTAILHETRNDIYKRLAQFAAKNLQGVDENKVYDALFIRDKKDDEEEHQNLNNGVTNDLKYFIRFHRALSVHATPTVAVNGVIVPSIESSTSVPDLEKIFASYV